MAENVQNRPETPLDSICESARRLGYTQAIRDILNHLTPFGDVSKTALINILNTLNKTKGV